MNYEYYRDSEEYFSVGRTRSFGHFHRALELVYCIRGEKSVTVGGVSLTVGEGELLLVPPFLTHIFPLVEGHLSLCVVLPVSYTDLLLEQSGGRMPKPQVISDRAVAGDLYRTLLKLKGETHPLIRAGIYTYTVGVLAKVADFCEDIADPSGSLQLRILAYIEKHYAEPITLESVAKAFGYSKPYFSTVFNESFHLHFKQYLNALRIDKSLRLLKDHTVAQTARAVGFANEQTYYANFKAVTGTTPAAYLRGEGAASR